MPKPLTLLQAVAFVDLLAVSLIMPQIHSYARQFGANHIHIGLLGSVYAGFQLASGPLIGSLSDIKGCKTILIVTLLMCGAAYTALGMTTSIYVILCIRGILGIFKQTQMLTRSLVPDYEKNEQKQSAIYGKMAAISGTGMTIGPIIGGHIVEDHPENGFTFIAVVVGICFLINSGLVYLLPKTKVTAKRKANKNQNEQPATTNILSSIVSSLKQSVVELYKVQWSDYWEIFMMKAFIGFAMGVYYSNYAIYLKTVYHLSPKYVGYAISFQGIIGVISSYFMEYINYFYRQDKDFSQRNFHVFVVISTALFGLITSYNVYLYLFWLVPLAIGNAVGRLVTLEMILTKSHGDHRGTLIGASNSVRSMTGVVSPMIAGFIGQYIGVSHVIYASLCSTALGCILSYKLRQKCLLVRVKED